MNPIKLLIIIGSVLFFTGIVFMAHTAETAQSDVKENKRLHLIIQEQNNTIEVLNCQIDTLNAIIEVSFNSAYRFEMILGVKNPDGILSWKEKCLVTPLAIQRLNHTKF
jgi:hypothetical protein